MLETRADAAPAPEDAFLVVDGAMRVQSISRGAEALLAVSETLAVQQFLTALLSPADAEPREASLAGAVHTTVDNDDITVCFVRPWNTFGVRMRARIAACGPPRAALIVLDGPPRPPEGVRRLAPWRRG